VLGIEIFFGFSFHPLALWEKRRKKGKQSKKEKPSLRLSFKAAQVFDPGHAVNLTVNVWLLAALE